MPKRHQRDFVAEDVMAVLSHIFFGPLPPITSIVAPQLRRKESNTKHPKKKRGHKRSI